MEKVILWFIKSKSSKQGTTAGLSFTITQHSKDKELKFLNVLNIRNMF